MLEGLTSISDAAAAALGNHDSNLNLGGLTSISDAQAEAFAKHQGGYLALYGQTELSDDAAEALAKYEGRLSVAHAQLPPSASKILKDAGHYPRAAARQSCQEGSDAWCAGWRTCSPDRIKSNGGPVAIELQMHRLCKS